MAAIGAIRKHSTILLLVVAIALLAFILGDMSSNRGNKIADKFITVDGVSVSYNEYMAKYEQYRQLTKEQNNGQSASPEEDFRLGTQVYEEMVDSVLIAKQSAYLGITVTDQEIRDLVSGPNPHQYAASFFRGQSGEYDMQLANQFLDNIDAYDSAVVSAYQNLEVYLAKETQINKYLNLLSHSYYMPTPLTKKMQEEGLLKATVEAVQVSYANELVADDKIGEVSQKELNEWYQANQYRFKQDVEYRDVDYVIFNVTPSSTDLKTIENKVKGLYDEFVQTPYPQDFVNRLVDARYDSTFFKQGELEPALDTLLFNVPDGTFVQPFINNNTWIFAKLLQSKIRPDSINVSFAFIAKLGTQEVKRTEAESKSKVEEALLAAKTGTDFYQVCQTYSDIPMEGQPDSGRVWMEDGVGGTQPFFDTLYFNEQGAIVAYEKTEGTYIFRINEKTASYKKIQVAIGRCLIEASEETIENIESQAHTFVNGLASLEAFNKAVTDKGLNKRSFERVELMSFTLPGVVGNGREIIRWIYDDKREQGNISDVFSMGEMYVVVALKGIYPEGYTPLEQAQVKNYAETMVKRDKKAAKLEKLLNTDVKAGQSLAAIAEKYQGNQNEATISFSDRNFSNFGPEPKLVGKLLGQKAGKTYVMSGDMGVYVVKVKTVDVPTIDVKPSDDTMISSQYQMMFANRVQSSTMSALKKMVKVKDNRHLMF